MKQYSTHVSVRQMKEQHSEANCLVKQRKKEICNTTMYAFLKDHPLCKTHKVKFDKQKKNTVPNFVDHFPDVIKEIENIIVPLC